MNQRTSAFTLIEVIFVISIIMVSFAVALPNFSIITGMDTAEKLGQLAVDVRSAYDMAVLHRKPYRLVFELSSGNYWLEAADRHALYIGDEKLNRDPSADEEKDAQDVFAQLFEEYQSLAGQEFRDSDSETVIKPFSPVLEARERLAPAKWSEIQNSEWSRRSIGADLLFKMIKCEHHGRDQLYSELGEKGRAMLYFFPHGYAEQCVMHIAYRLNDTEIDTTQEPYTLTINSYDGTAEIISGEHQVELKDSEEQ